MQKHMKNIQPYQALVSKTQEQLDKDVVAAGILAPLEAQRLKLEEAEQRATTIEPITHFKSDPC